MADSITEERIEGPTPEGGDYAIAYYRDANGDLTPKSQATQVAIAEFRGTEPFFWTYGTLNEVEQSDSLDTLPKPQPPLRGDAEPTPEDLVLGAVKVLYGGFDNWEVRGIRDLRQGIPEGGLTVEVAILEDDGEVLLLEGVWDGAEWRDRLLSEDKSDSLRLDAPKKGGKGGGAKSCKKGRPCGRSCIAKSKQCRQNPDGIVKEALNRASNSGGTASQGNGIPISVQAKIIADSLAGNATAIVKYDGLSVPPKGDGQAKYFTNEPDPGTRKMTTRELQKGVKEAFGEKTLAGLRENPQYKLATFQRNIDLTDNASIREVYREWVDIPRDERNPKPGPATINGINIMRNFQPWQVFGIDDPASSTRAELKSAYRKTIMGRHPDQGGDRVIFDRLRNMYESLDIAFELAEQTAPKKRRGKQ
jgi:hypothetical protein